jgi:myo-inositol 2-dehydrogenase / D-chiro-inositol 1-dehydrogenase
MLRFALVGYGAWGQCHADAIRRTPGCELTAVCTSSPQSAAAAAEATGARAFADYRALLAHAEAFDVVDVVAPNHLHEELAVAALTAGKHVLLEKPMAPSVAACDRILDAARRHGGILYVGHELRLSVQYGRIREIVRSGRIGEPRYVSVDLWRRPYRPGRDGWRSDPNRVGNWILEEPVHYLDLAAWFFDGFGRPASVFAQGNRSDRSLVYHAGQNDNFAALIGFEGGGFANVSQSLAAVEYHISVKVFGSQGVLRSEWHAELDRSERPEFALSISSGDALESLAVPSTPGELFELREQIRTFEQAVVVGKPLPIQPEEARRAVQLCEAATESLLSGLPVDLR